ncbi:translation initiation factor IF-3 [Scardovia inopinata]|uniref:Translation initiation factor IF-3 n=1 Tax=Scardovia inopinata F0304 TaxID=641146 RepID=W1MXI5_SCAIO|nr:translation initiation factor IF-3 [Scardovia inopinata F0304]SUV50961.1 translation initiation factor IF-3 [Scardovia inopinata]
MLGDYDARNLCVLNRSTRNSSNEGCLRFGRLFAGNGACREWSRPCSSGIGGEDPKERKRNGVIISEQRINDEIRASEVRLIGPQGEQVGIVKTTIALNLAREANLDLVEVSAHAKPPVAKLIDYGKYKYNEKIKARQARRNQSTAEVKETRFRLKIDDHDFEVKKNQVSRFLEGGDKVKVSIMLRGREQSRPVGGIELLQRLADEVEEFGSVESAPRRDGRNIIMVLAPKGKKVHKQSEQRRRGAGSREERQARQQARLSAKKKAQKAAAAQAEETLKSLGIDTAVPTSSAPSKNGRSGSKSQSSSATKTSAKKTSSHPRAKKASPKEGNNAKDEK